MGLKMSPRSSQKTWTSLFVSLQPFRGLELTDRMRKCDSGNDNGDVTVGDYVMAVDSEGVTTDSDYDVTVDDCDVVRYFYKQNHNFSKNLENNNYRLSCARIFYSYRDSYQLYSESMKILHNKTEQKLSFLSSKCLDWLCK